MHLFYKCTRFYSKKRQKKGGKAAFMNEPFPLQLYLILV